MGRPKNGYYLKNGTRVPSVTTVLSQFKDPGPLMFWAWRQGQEGKDFRETRDAAASSGTLAHTAIEEWKHGREMVWPADGEIVERAKRAFGAFLEWADQTRLKIDKTEMPLVSEKYAYGGTFDAILVGTKRAMGDWKSASGIYPESLMQLAAYGKLWEENFPDEKIAGGFHLLRFDKEYGDFQHKWWDELNAAWSCFIRLREAYDFMPELKARAK